MTDVITRKNNALDLNEQRDWQSDALTEPLRHRQQHSESYRQVRANSVAICAPLQTEDYVVQPYAEVSPPKWHLAHTTWFFMAAILKQYASGYRDFNPDYSRLFNS